MLRCVSGAQIDLTIALLSELVTHLNIIDGHGYCFEEFEEVGRLIEAIGEEMSDVIAPDDRKDLYRLCRTLHFHGKWEVGSFASEFKDARKLFRPRRKRSKSYSDSSDFDSDSDCDDDESDEESEDGNAAVSLCCMWAGTGLRRAFTRWAIDWC